MNKITIIFFMMFLQQEESLDFSELLIHFFEVCQCFVIFMKKIIINSLLPRTEAGALTPPAGGSRGE